MADDGARQFDLFDGGGATAVAMESQPPAVQPQPEVYAQPVARQTETSNLRNGDTASGAIRDAGQELVANRRNRARSLRQWSDVADLNDALKVREVVKANVWPKPDYEQLIKDGMQPVIAHIVKQVYDSVSAKPKAGRWDVQGTDQVLQAYIAELQRVEAGVMAWAQDTDALRGWTQSTQAVAGAMLGRPTALGSIHAPSGKRLLDIVYPNGWREYQTAVQLAGGNKLLAALQPGYEEARKGFKAVKEGWPQKRESWDVQGFRVVDKPQVEVRDYSSGRKEPLHLLMVDGRNVSSHPTPELAQQAASEVKPFALFGKRGFLASYDTEEEAIASARERSKRGKKDTISDKGVRVEAVEREGPYRRMEGEEVTSERMVAEFGLKGVNFGNWMKTPAARAEAQLHLNHAFDAFHDLADILGVPPKALSLNGMLGLAIGAQGNGGAYAAHFVPGVNEINLTRTSGAGSLAHEFAHALDHYFAAQGGLASATEPFLTEHASLGATRTVIDRLPQGAFAPRSVQRFGNLRPEIVASFDHIVQSMNRRDQTPEEMVQAKDVRLEKNKKGTAGWLGAIRRDFAEGPQREAFDVLASKVMSGDIGSGHVAQSSKVYLSPVLDEMRELYKSFNGRLYPLKNLSALQSWVREAQHLRAKGLADAEHVPQKVTTEFAENARELDKDKGGKAYWSTNLEKFARAFDAFVTDELEARQQKNGYLSHTDREGRTVPMGEERVAVNEAFRNLVGALETRETEQSVVLLSAGAQFGARPSMPRAALNAEIGRLRRQWPSMPPVTVVDGVKDLPFKVASNTDGAYWAGKVFVVADNVADLKQLQKVMAHECILHHSVEEMLGNYGFSKLHHGLQKLKADGDPTVVALAEDIRRRYGELPPEIETKEIVARAGEQCLDANGNVKIEFGFMKSVFAGIAGWLRDRGIDIPFTNTELQGIMHAAGEWIQREDPGAERESNPTAAAATALNSFAGVRAETAPLDALRMAREMRLNGDDDRVIWEHTGWTFAFPDGKPRFEISDDRADVVIEGRTIYQIWKDIEKVDPSVNNISQFLQKYPDSPLSAEVNNHQGVRAAYESLRTDNPATAREIENYLVHADLYKAYPQLANIKAAQPSGMEGITNAGAAALIPDHNLIKYSKINNSDQFKSSTLHELQHAIQDIEGFSRGGSTNEFFPMDMTERELRRVNETVCALYEAAPEFYRDCVKATQLQLAVVDKYGSLQSYNVDDPLVKEWWEAIDRRDEHPQSVEWYAQKAVERQIARDRVTLSPMDQYSRLAGEVEARLTQARLDMSPLERRAGYPLDDMDRPVAGQALRFGGKAPDLVHDGVHIGKIVDLSDGVATQKVNRDGKVVRHLVSRLTEAVEIGEVVNITYQDRKGMVVERSSQLDKGPGR